MEKYPIYGDIYGNETVLINYKHQYYGPSFLTGKIENETLETITIRVNTTNKLVSVHKSTISSVSEPVNDKGDSK